MINTVLLVEDICHDCPNFSPEYSHERRCSHGKVVDQYIQIKCEHGMLCAHIRRHLEKKEVKR